MSSTFSTLRQRGYSTFYALRIEGVPYTFYEGPVPKRVDSEAYPSAGAGYNGSASLAVIDESRIDQEIERRGAVTRGKSLPLLLSWNVLEDEGVLDDLFRRPAYFTTLTADLSGTATTVAVLDNSSFPSSGSFYLGKEYIKYTGKTGSTAFTGCTRGYLGYPYLFRKDDPGSHGILTPTPYAWKGRYITLYEHLVSPEGRILDDTLCEGSYSRELFKGFLTGPPKPDKLGMRLDALPLQRACTLELGSNLQGTTIGVDPSWDSSPMAADYPIYVDETSTVTFTVKPKTAASTWGDQKAYTVPTIETGAAAPTSLHTISGDSIPPGVYTVGQWALLVLSRLKYAMINDASVSPSYSNSLSGFISVDVGIKGLSAGEGITLGEYTQVPVIRFSFAGDMDAYSYPVSMFVDPGPGAYWAESLGVDHITPSDTYQAWQNGYVSFDLRLDVRKSKYLVVKNLEGDSALDFTIEDTGLASVEAGDNSEVVRWDAKYDTSAFGVSISPYVVLRVVERMIGAEYATVPQLAADLGVDGTINIVSGIIDKLDVAAATFIESSGTGLRGDNDTLGIGYGLGIPSAWLDLNGVGASPSITEALPLIAIGGASFEDIFSGWYQLEQVCLALRRDSSNVLRLMKVETSPSKVISTDALGYLGSALAKADVVVGGTGIPSVVIAPNQVSVDTTVGPYESAQYAFNAVGRIQAEGASSLSLTVPGGRSDVIASGVLSIMARGAGQSVVSFQVAPWVEIQVGDPVEVTVAHPLLYDWSSGTRSPSSIAARCVGQSYNLKTGEQSLTLLLGGLLESALWLCPTVNVTNVSGNDVTVSYGGYWKDGERVRLYNRGKEGSEMSDVLISTVSGNVLSLSSSAPSWLDTSSKATIPDYSVASTAQQAPYLFTRVDKQWSA